MGKGEYGHVLALPPNIHICRYVRKNLGTHTYVRKIISEKPYTHTHTHVRKIIINEKP